MFKVIIDYRAQKETLSISDKNQAQIIRVIKLFKQWEFNLTEKHLKRISKKLWELKAGQVRLLFGIAGSAIVIVNVFLKKTQKTPTNEIKTALQRLKIYYEI